jgi:hypothetical protein
MHFDPTISLGSLIWGITTTVAAILFWRDLDWRVRNLETWRKEHQIDADARDRLIESMKEILLHVRWQTDYMLGKRGAPVPADRPDGV